MTSVDNREFVFSDSDFGWVRGHIEDRTGIHLPETKRSLVYNRLSSRLRTLGLTSFRDYLALLQRDDSGESEQFVNAITTNVTAFFRESHHFEFLANTVLPEAFARNRSRRIRIWSAGCSTGMEPYSIAMVVREVTPTGEEWDIKVLASDVDTRVLEMGAQGVYSEERSSGISDERRKRFVYRGVRAQTGHIKMRPELQSLISFRYLNLVEPWPMQGPFDAIFCRNVVIYFQRPTQDQLWSRFASLLRSNGYLFVGHSETVLRSASLRSVGRTIYQKKGSTF